MSSTEIIEQALTFATELFGSLLKDKNKTKKTRYLSMVQLTKPLPWVKLINTCFLLKYFRHIKTGVGRDFKPFLASYTYILTSYSQTFLELEH